MILTQDLLRLNKRVWGAEWIFKGVGVGCLKEKLFIHHKKKKYLFTKLVLNYRPRRKKQRTKQNKKLKRVVLVIKDGFSVYDPLKCLNSQTVHSVSPIFPCYFLGRSLSLRGRYLNLLSMLSENWVYWVGRRTGMGGDFIPIPCNHGQFAVTRNYR